MSGSRERSAQIDPIRDGAIDRLSSPRVNPLGGLVANKYIGRTVYFHGGGSGGDDDKGQYGSDNRDDYVHFRTSWRDQFAAIQAEKLAERLRGKSIRTPAELHVDIRILLRTKSLFVDDDGRRYEPMKIGDEWKLVEVDQVDIEL